MPHHNLCPRDLMTALWAGSYRTAEQGALQLLGWHGHWIVRQSVAKFISVYITEDGTPVAALDWAGLARVSARLAGSSSELAVLAIAVSLAMGKPVDLGAAVVGLGRNTAAAVGDAILTAAGYGDR